MQNNIKVINSESTILTQLSEYVTSFTGFGDGERCI